MRIPSRRRSRPTADTSLSLAWQTTSAHDATPGLYDPAASLFYLRNSNSTGAASVALPFGVPGGGWLPVAGDWDGQAVSPLMSPAALAKAELTPASPPRAAIVQLEPGAVDQADPAVVAQDELAGLSGLESLDLTA